MLRRALALVGVCAALASARCGGDGTDVPLVGSDASTTNDAPSSLDDATASDGTSDAVDADVDGAAPDVDAADAQFVDATDAADAADGSDSADAGTTALRFVNLVPDLAASVDFRVAPQGGSFVGPYMATRGVAAGLAYTQVSELAIVAGALVKVRVVGVGSSDCSTPLAGVADLESIAAADAPWTIALMGSAGDASANLPALAKFADDPTPLVPSARFRVIHASPTAGAIDLALGAGAFTTAEQTSLAFGAATTTATQVPFAATPDSAGYIDLSVDVQVTASRSGSDVTSFWTYGKQGTSAFFVGLAGSSATPLGFVACDEAAAPSGHLTQCTVHTGPPVTAPLRILDLAPDAPAFDLCVGSYKGAIVGPLLGGVGHEQSFLQLSDVTPVPAYSYLVVFFVTHGQDCTGQVVSTGAFLAGVTEHTLTLVESMFPPSIAYSAFVTDTSFAGASTQATALAASYVADDGETVDLFDTPSGGLEQKIVTALGPGDVSALISLSAGTHSLRVADDATSATLASSTGISFASNQRVGWFWFHDAAGHGALARCDLALPGTSSFATCGE